MPERTVLVVDDDDDVRAAVACALEEDGYTVGLAENGRVALDALLAGARPELILLDMMMPEMDGWAFRTAQRAHPELASIPVILFTANGASRETLDRFGVQGHLPKPVRLDDLLDTVARVGGGS